MPLSPTLPARDLIDGTTVQQWSTTTTDHDAAFNTRPVAGSPQGLVLTVANKHFVKVTNQKALQVSPAFRGIYASAVNILNCLIEDVWRKGDGLNGWTDAAGVHHDGLHTDFVYVGPGVPAGFNCDVLLQDLELDNGDAQPSEITTDGDGNFRTVTYRRVHSVNVGTPHKVSPKVAGEVIGELVIDQCPGEKFALVGLGKFTKVTITNSPGVLVSQQCTVDAISYDAASTPAQPGGATPQPPATTGNSTSAPAAQATIASMTPNDLVAAIKTAFDQYWADKGIDAQITSLGLRIADEGHVIDNAMAILSSRIAAVAASVPTVTVTFPKVNI